ncbi:PilT protein domain protein [Desulfamplus magnetovallimortis]|uniref:PilT protein domain protein n=1 Tax=Desulfamplus magnetovallimortis TaxID=1246637 RepID=A0A1W1HL59_9BACT|nr:type II toxin-antitoxin system VapC family toxin [Desulfamplus magnetovallimortis]SLM33165.1 PilT protein domain protein [Desulfamplus magnetovallimortis]
MKILLDTHVFLWWIIDEPKLSPTACDLIGNGNNDLYWSTASSWEVAIKYALGRLPLPDDPLTFIIEELEENDVKSLSISHIHAFEAALLPLHHKDPFDRMLIAQARTESMVILSCDSCFGFYEVNVKW